MSSGKGLRRKVIALHRRQVRLQHVGDPAHESHARKSRVSKYYPQVLARIAQGIMGNFQKILLFSITGENVPAESLKNCGEPTILPIFPVQFCWSAADT